MKKISTVSLELAKALKEKGFPQEAKFYWNRLSDCPDGTEDWNLVDFKMTTAIEVYAASTADEILDRLPQILQIEGKKYQLFISMGVDRQSFLVYAYELDYNDNAPFPIRMCHSLGDAAAQMYLYLKKEGLLPDEGLSL